MKTIEQLRAANALQRVTELRAKSEKFRKCYRAYVDRLSPAIVMNGLGQALASERSAAGAPPPTDPDKQAHHELYRSLHNWLCRQKEGVYPGQADLLEALMTHDESFYLRAQAEALAWLLWHKKFCRAEFPSGEEG
jgi:CRISPR-associated protein Cmr5